MDKSISEETKKKVYEIIHSHDEIKKVIHFNSTPVGYKYQISFTIYVDGNLSTFESHEIADKLEKEIGNKTISVDNCDFINCKEEAGANGGIINLSTKSSLYIDDATFTNCTGATIYAPAENQITFGPEFNTVALFRKKVLLPFTLPGGFRPNRVKLDWRDYGEDTNYADIGTVNMRHNLWISKGDLSMNYSLETLQRHELYTAEIDAVGSFRLVGTFFHQIEQAQEGDPDFTQTLSLPYVLENGPFTLLTTVFIDQDQIAFDSAGLPTQEMIPQGQYAAYKTNGILFGSSGITYDLSQAYFALKGGWSPNITFLE